MHNDDDNEREAREVFAAELPAWLRCYGCNGTPTWIEKTSAEATTPHATFWCGACAMTHDVENAEKLEGFFCFPCMTCADADDANAAANDAADAGPFASVVVPLDDVQALDAARGVIRRGLDAYNAAVQALDDTNAAAVVGMTPADVDALRAMLAHRFNALENARVNAILDAAVPDCVDANDADAVRAILDVIRRR